MTVALILDELTRLPVEEHLDYIAKNNQGPLTDIEILEMFNEQQSLIDASGVVGGIASDIINHIDAKYWVGKTFGNWIATDVIHDTYKSIILKGEPVDNSHTQTVAIKILSPTFQAMSNDKHQAMQAHYIEKLKSPNMVEMKSAASTDDGTNYIVMEYLNNGDIVSFCSDNEFSLNKRLSLFLQVCNGVIHMHQNMIVHSDLKPQNILIDSSFQPKIIDLDLSLALDNNINEEFLYKNIKGHTNHYAAPEQKKGENATALTDIYALGKVLKDIILGAKNKVLDKQSIKKEHPTADRINELIAIIEKCCYENRHERYESVSELKSDIETYLTARNITNAYKPYTNLIYRTYRYIFGRKKIFITTGAFVFIISFGMLGIINEKNSANEALNLMAKMFDPREMNEKIEFERKATEVLNDESFFNPDQFNKLITFGDGYYGRGRALKSIEFFEKAKSIYPEVGSPQNIIASTKLALAYFSIWQHAKANEQFSQYKKDIFDAKLEKPELIQMFLAYIEVNSRFRSLLKDIKRSTLAVLKDIELDQYNDNDQRLLTELQIQYYLGVENYYSSELGDYASNSTYQSQEKLETITDPLTLKSKQYFLNSLNILKENNINTHYEGLIYSWLGRLEGELRNYDLALAYIDISLQKTMQIYGEYHPTTIDVYSKKYVILRNYKPIEAVKVTDKINQLAEVTHKDMSFRLLFLYIQSEAYNNIGDWKTVLKIAEKAHSFYKKEQSKAEKSQKDISIHIIISTLNIITSITEMYPIFTGSFDHLIQAEAHLDTLDAIYIDGPEAESKYSFYNTIKDFSNFDIQEVPETFIERLTLTNHSEKNNNAYYSEKIKLAELCLSIEGCDPHDYVSYETSLTLDNSYTNREKDFSSIYFTEKIRLAFVFLSINEYDTAIKIIEPLLSKDGFKLNQDGYYVHLSKYIFNVSKYKISDDIRYLKLANKAKKLLNNNLGKDYKFEFNLSDD